jgi:Tol biopolymer transport system component
MRRGQIRNLLAAAVATLVMLGVATLVAQQSPRELIERARLLEENSRTLDRAIALYEQVVADPNADRALAASAQLRVALLKERQGKPEARAVFASVVQRYPDQRDIVAEARTRLGTSRAMARTTDLVPRLIRNDRSFPSAISPDGRQALVVTDVDGSPRLALQDVGTGQMATLVQGSDRGWARNPVFSPDGRQVAYSWVALDRPRASGPPVPNATTSLRIIDATPGAKPRIVAGPSVGWFALVPAGWSPDGTAVLVHRATRAAWDSPLTGSELAWVDVGTGVARPIKDVEPWRDIGGAGRAFGFNGVSLSPDGRFVTYSVRVRENSSERSIHIVGATGERASVIVSIAGINTQPIWTPDGTHLLFINERSGRRGLWTVPVRDGAATGEPRAVAADFSGQLLEMPRTGELFHVRTADDGTFWQFVAERGASGARITQAFPGQGARWSRGNRLAFTRHGTEGRDFIVRTAAGEERLYQHAGLSNVSPKWFSDDSAVVLFVEPLGDNGTPGGAFYKLDITSGTFTRLFARNTAAHERSFSTVLSPDNKMLYMSVRAQDKGPWTAIVGVDLATGVERSLLTFPTPLSGRSQPGLALSPDGTTLAIHTWADETSQDGRLLTVRLDGTGFRELVGPFAGGGWSDRVSWTPDAQSILFVRQQSPGPEGSWQMMQVPVTGGAALPDGLDTANFTSAVRMPRVETGNVSGFGLSADGTRIVFSSRTIPTYDLRVLDNVLAVLAP